MSKWTDEPALWQQVLSSHRAVEVPLAEPDPEAEPTFECGFCKNPYPCKPRKMAEAARKAAKGGAPDGPGGASSPSGVVKSRQEF